MKTFKLIDLNRLQLNYINFPLKNNRHKYPNLSDLFINKTNIVTEYESRLLPHPIISGVYFHSRVHLVSCILVPETVAGFSHFEFFFRNIVQTSGHTSRGKRLQTPMDTRHNRGLTSALPAFGDGEGVG